LVPVRKQPGLKDEAFSPALLVPVATTGTNGRYRPGPMAFFPPVSAEICFPYSTDMFIFISFYFLRELQRSFGKGDNT
jgi:hypothetical protein